MIDGFFVGVDTPVGDRINVMAEYLNRDVNFGVRARLWERFSVQASVLDMDDVAVSACYSWPLGRRTAGLDPIITADSTTPSGPPGPVATVQVKTDQAQMAKPPATAPANTAPVTPTDPAPTVQTTNETPATVTAGQPPATQPDKPTPTSVSVTPESPRDPFAVGTQVDPGKPEVPMVLDVFPEVENGEVCVPVRAVAQWLGFRVKAEAGKRGIEVTVFAGQDAVSFLIGDDRVCFQGETVDLPAATYYHRQRTAMAPAKLFRLLGVPTETDADAGRALFERHDVIGIAACGK